LSNPPALAGPPKAGCPGWLWNISNEVDSTTSVGNLYFSTSEQYIYLVGAS